MPLALLIPMLMGALATAMASMIGRALLAIGLGFITYSGISLAVGIVKTNAINGVNALPADAIGIIGYLWLDKAMTLIFSAVVAAVAMKGIAGSVKKAVFK